MPPIPSEPLGLGIFIPSSPSSPSLPCSSDTATLLSPPPFITPSRQLRRSRVNTATSPRSLGTRGGFRSISDKLPGSIYRGEENPFAPYPDEEREEEGKSKEYDAAVLYTELDEGLNDGLDPADGIGRLDGDGDYLVHRPSTYFDPSTSAVSTPKIVVGRSRRRNLSSTPGSDPSNAEYNLGPGPGLASPGGIHSPRIPDPSTPSTPTLPVAYSSASPSPGIGLPGTPSLGFGRLASALAEDIPPLPNPLFVASVALSVVVGVLIVGIVSCSVAYCRRNKQKRRGETGEEKGPASPKRSMFGGGESTRKLFMRSSDTLTSLSPSSNMSLLTSGGSRPPSILKSASSPTDDNEDQGKGGKAGSRISFVESHQAGLVLTAAVDLQKQLYTPPPWQPERSSPLTRPPINSPTQHTGPKSALPPSRLSICAITPLEAIQEEEQDTHVRDIVQIQSRADDEKESEEGSYHSCSDNSSMTTHASDDIFALAPSSEGHDDITSSVPTESMPERPKSRASYRRNSLGSIASLSLDYLSRTSPETPISRESTPDGDTSFDTLSSASPRTPRASTSEPNFIAYLDSPLGLDLDLVLSGELDKIDKKDSGRRKTMATCATSGSSTRSVSKRVRRQMSLRWLDEETQISPGEGGPRKVLFADTTPSEGVRLARPKSGYIPRDLSNSEKIKRSRSLPHKPLPMPIAGENRKSVFRRAFKALSVIAKEPDMDITAATPPRPSRQRSTLRGVEYDQQRQSLQYGSPRPYRDGPEYDHRERSRFSTVSWDELGCGEGFDAYYLGYDRSDPRGQEEEEEAQQDEEDLEINNARISFGFLSSDIGHSECAFELESYPFPEPASHLPHIRITSH